MKNFRKSQAAMEFLMTYGWAILVVLVAIGALAYFGVLSPDRFLPARCQLPAGVACSDFRILEGTTPTTGTVDIVLRNGLGFDIGTAAQPVTVSVSGCTVSDTTPNTIANGGVESYQATSCSIVAGQKFSGDINVSYRNVDSGLDHKIQGTITGRSE